MAGYCYADHVPCGCVRCRVVSEVIGLVVDIGVGALAYRLATQLGSVVKDLKAIVGALSEMVKDHESRIKRLEEK